MTLVDETDDLVKISLSPYHNRAQEIDDYCTEHLNNHIALGLYVRVTLLI